MTYSRSSFAFGLIIVLLACAGGCARPKAVPQPKPEIKKPQAVGKRILLIVPQSNFSDQEFETLRTVFGSEGAEMESAAPRATTANGVGGLLIPADVALELVDTDAYDAFVFVGGKGASSLFQDEYALKLAREAASQNKVLGATSAATLLLGLAGVLEDKNATCPPRLARSFTDIAKCRYEDQAMVADGKIITARDANACADFAHAIVRLLHKPLRPTLQFQN